MDITGECNEESACKRFHSLRRISEGAFGDVKLGVDKHTGAKVALKFVRLSSHGIPRAIFREIEALKQVKHERIIDLIAVYPSDVNLVLVFEYMASDLQHELSRVSKFLSEPLVKYYTIMLLQGLRHCHSMGIVHRDIKPSNILVSSQGTVKLADFGLARVLDLSSDASLSHQVATRWYRAPELLYGSRHYDFAVDMWSAGAVVAELLMLAPLFPGNNDLDQLFRVFQVTGTPDIETWPEVQKLPDFGKVCFPEMQAMDLELLMPRASSQQLEFLSLLIKLNPAHRLSANQACANSYLMDAPLVHPSVDDELMEEARLPSDSGGRLAGVVAASKKATGGPAVAAVLDSVILSAS